VTITGGEQQRNNSGKGNGAAWSVPKRDLLALVQVLLERKELRLAKGLRELGSLVRELTDVRSTMRASGRERLGADGCGEHDDLVIALALACWRARRRGSDMGVVQCLESAGRASSRNKQEKKERYMSVAGYIGKNVKELRFPRESTDDLGVHYNGAEEGLKKERVKGDEDVYESVVDYDPVLHAHCRL
jgi:hypothetical protein